MDASIGFAFRAPRDGEAARLDHRADLVAARGMARRNDGEKAAPLVFQRALNEGRMLFLAVMRARGEP